MSEYGYTRAGAKIHTVRFTLEARPTPLYISWCGQVIPKPFLAWFVVSDDERCWICATAIEAHKRKKVA